MIGRRIPIAWVAAATAIALVAGAALRGAISEPASETTSTPTDGPTATRGVVRTSATGPKRWIDGIPSGFAHDEDGALAASTTFITLGGSVVNAGPAAVRPVISAISASSTAERRVAETVVALDDLRSRLSGGTGPVVLVQAPVMVRIDDYSDERASITMWTTTVLARRGVADPQSTWSTVTFELVWERGDWRLLSETSIAGPTPDQSSDAVPPSFDEFESALRGSRPIGSER